MQLLIVDVNLSHLWLDALARLLLERLRLLLLFDRIPLSGDTRVSNVGCKRDDRSASVVTTREREVGRTRQLELGALHAPLALEVVALGVPMARNGDRAAGQYRAVSKARKRRLESSTWPSTHLRYDLSSTSSRGSRADGSVHSITSGWATSVLSSATLSLYMQRGARDISASDQTGEG